VRPDQFEDWLSGAMGAKDLRPVDHDYLQRWLVSRWVISSKADDNNASLITQTEAADRLI
jgi:hypothetical protein